MKYLDDLSIFEKESASIVSHSGNYVLYANGHCAARAEQWVMPETEETLQYPILTNFFAKFTSQKFYFQRRIRPNYISIGFILSGKHYVCCGNKGYVAEVGDIILLQPNVDGYISYPENQECQKYGVTIQGNKLNSLLKTLELDRVNCVQVTDMDTFIKTFDNLQKVLVASNGQPEDYRANSMHSFGLLQLISSLKKNDPIDEAIELTLKYLKNNLHTKINMDDVAALIGKSTPTFTKLFQQVTNLTPYQHLTKIRMNQAYELLQTKKYSVKEVSSMVGHASATHFSIEFKKFYGFPPSVLLF